ncbi:MAG: hypothetical protein NT070_06235 [Cyanobacteria bacterium]|nr:hypothetical protein [Cyanobacteriota bacterium]
MNQYLVDTDYAVRQLIELVTAEEIQIAQIQLACEAKQPKLEFLYKRCRDSEWSDDVDEIKLQFYFVSWAREQKEVTDLQEEIKRLELSIDIKKDSINVLCGALLQIAKQGISKVYGSLDSCPDGRGLGSEKLKNLIWQGRNQSLHYEEGHFRRPVQDCFANLAATFGNQVSLALHPQENLAYEVIEILGWKQYSVYISDMQSLLPG